MKYEKKTYPDGTFYPVITDFSQPTITERINSYDDLWFIKQLKDVLDANHSDAFLRIPCLIDGQADRRFNKNESANLKLICQFINDMKFKTVEVFHPHNQEVVEALIENVRIETNVRFISKVLTNISSDNLIMMSPDAGAFKWITKTADAVHFSGEVYGASKSRKFVDGKSVLTQIVDKQDFDGKDVLIVDDICIYGGSAIGLAKILKTRNVGKLYLAVSHITVQKPNPELFTLFDKIYSTNSKYDAYYDGEGFQPNNLTLYNVL